MMMVSMHMLSQLSQTVCGGIGDSVPSAWAGVGDGIHLITDGVVITRDTGEVIGEVTGAPVGAGDIITMDGGVVVTITAVRDIITTDLLIQVDLEAVVRDIRHAQVVHPVREYLPDRVVRLVREPVLRLVRVVRLVREPALQLVRVLL